MKESDVKESIKRKKVIEKHEARDTESDRNVTMGVITITKGRGDRREGEGRDDEGKK